MLTIRISRRRRVLAALLLLPTLALRAVIPAGFMPGTHAGAGIAMQFCTSQGMQTMIVSTDGTLDTGAPAVQHDAPCAYAVGGFAAPLPELACEVAGIAPAPTLVAFVATAAFASTPFVRAHSPRGPPALRA